MTVRLKIFTQALSLLLLSSCGGGNSSNGTFKQGYYYGDLTVQSGDEVCALLSDHVNYSVLITESDAGVSPSTVKIEKVSVNRFGVFPMGIEVTLPADAGETSFDDVDEHNLPTMYSIGSIEPRLLISCFTDSSTVHLTAQESTIDFFSESHLSCVNDETGQPFTCEITEKGVLTPPLNSQ